MRADHHAATEPAGDRRQRALTLDHSQDVAGVVVEAGR
jgi:hypothetical protein